MPAATASAHAAAKSGDGATTLAAPAAAAPAAAAPQSQLKRRKSTKVKKTTGAAF